MNLTHVCPAFPQVSSESYATPQTSVASRRVARGRVIRAASVPPRSAPPAYSEVDRIKATTAASTTTTKTSGIKFVPSRPIIVYTVRPEYDRRARSVPPQVKRAEARAASVPPSVFYGGRAEEKAQPRVVTTWRSVAERWIRSSSAPPARRRRRALRATPRFIFDEPPPPPLPTANLRAHKVPRRFLSRGPVRTPFSSLYGYYQHDRPLVRVRKPDRTAEEEQRARIRRLVLMSRVLGSSSMRVSPAQPRSRVGARVRSLLAPAAPKPKALPARQSLIGFPQVYVPSKGPKPSNRAKVTFFFFLAIALTVLFFVSVLPPLHGIYLQVIAQTELSDLPWLSESVLSPSPYFFLWSELIQNSPPNDLLLKGCLCLFLFFCSWSLFAFVS